MVDTAGNQHKLIGTIDFSYWLTLQQNISTTLQRHHFESVNELTFLTGHISYKVIVNVSAQSRERVQKGIVPLRSND